MKVVVIKDKSENVVKKMVWYNVGEEDEEKGVQGIENFIENMMLKGKKKKKEGEFQERIE